MALIVSGIANKGGEIVKPILVKEAISPEGTVIRSNSTKVISNGANIFTANEVKI